MTHVSPCSSLARWRLPTKPQRPARMPPWPTTSRHPSWPPPSWTPSPCQPSWREVFFGAGRGELRREGAVWDPQTTDTREDGPMIEMNEMLAIRCDRQMQHTLVLGHETWSLQSKPPSFGQGSGEALVTHDARLQGDQCRDVLDGLEDNLTPGHGPTRQDGATINKGKGGKLHSSTACRIITKHTMPRLGMSMAYDHHPTSNSHSSYGFRQRLPLSSATALARAETTTCV